MTVAVLRIDGITYMMNEIGDWCGPDDERRSELQSQFHPAQYPQDREMWPIGRKAVLAAESYFAGVASFAAKPGTLPLRGAL